MKKVCKLTLAFFMIAAVAATFCTAPADAVTYKDITAKQAKAIALKDAKAKASKIKKYKIRYDKDDRSYELGFVNRKNCRKYTYEIDRATGIIMERDVEYKYRKTGSIKKVGKKAAIKKVIKVSGIKASIVRSGTCTYRYKDREGTYQVKFRYGNRVYEYEILAPCGKVKEIEYKYVGKMPKK